MKKLNIKFYQNLGKLFYAIAATDKNVREEEFDKLKQVVKSEWITVDEIEDDFHTDAAYQIEIVFDWLYKEKKLDAKKLFDNFIAYKNDQPHLFPKNIKQLILKTANAVAASFHNKNKSELIMLANLEISLK
jgi:hypothetical protein